MLARLNFCLMNLSCRLEKSEDKKAVFELNKKAFESDAEAQLVDKLRQEAVKQISVVALFNSKIVAHAFFSEVTVGTQKAMALGPVAVLPEHQNKGIGSSIIRYGLKQCEHQGEALVFVLGHDSYYPRFGFKLAEPNNIFFAANTEKHFFYKELKENAAKNVAGKVLYASAFYDL